MASLKLSNANQSNQAVRPSFKARAAALKALAARVVRSEPTSPPKPQSEPDLVDWHSPPPGFMAYPAIDPQAFVNIPEGLRLELERLHDIACGEFERRAEAAGKGLHETMRAKIEDGLRQRLRLDGIEAALLLEPAISISSAGDPILAAIQEAERLQYAVDIASKAPQPPGTVDPLPEQKAAFDAFDAHVDNVLLTTVPATTAGCAALARFAAAYPPERGFSLDDDENGQHVRILKLIARSPALRTQPPAGTKQASRGLVDRVDFAAATLDELHALHDTARLVGDVAHAAVWQGRCQKANSGAGSNHNAAGELMHWLGDALSSVESAAADELQRRRPVKADDRQMRLAAIAERIILNDDADETRTFIRDLTAFAAEQAER